MGSKAEETVIQRFISLVNQYLQRQETSRAFAHLTCVIEQKFPVHPVLDPWMITCSGLTLRNLIGMMNRNGINASAVKVKLVTKICHAHGRTLNVPAGISPTPR